MPALLNFSARPHVQRPRCDWALLLRLVPLTPRPGHDMLVRSFGRLASATTLLLALGTMAVRPLHAQSADIIVGTVSDPSGKPVAGAKVDAFSIETEVTRSATT